jgi:hypothetical protein
MRTTNGFLTHLIFVLGALAFAMTGATGMGVTTPVTSSAEELPAGVVVDDGVPF